MDRFLVENAAKHKALVAAFKPKTPSPSQADKQKTPNPDVVVTTRIRPVLDDESIVGAYPAVFPRKDKADVVDCHELRKTIRGDPALNTSTFNVDRVFGPDDTTDTIFTSVVAGLVPWAWSGGVGTLFAYGQTGSGKTFTVSGLEKLVAESLMGGTLEGERKVYACVVELAGNTALDLLNARRPVSVLTDSFGETQLAGALEQCVTSTDDLLRLVETAARLRATAPTVKNDASSRSHAICRLRLENNLVPGLEDGLLYLVDLAGSEAARDVAAHGADRMRETREINASLSTLKDCIRGRALHDYASSLGGRASVAAKKNHVPFRQSTLTKVLRHVFDPDSSRACRTVVVACVNPCIADTAASRNTLRYAEMLRIVVPKQGPRPYDARAPATWDTARLREWIENSSGSPHVSAEILAPFESGPQLLRLPAPEFIARCLKTRGVTPEQARAFQSKFWQLHVDSSRSPTAPSSTDSPAFSSTAELLGFLGTATEGGSSSAAVPEKGGVLAPFRERVRPGMVVRWKLAGQYRHFISGQDLAVVLCPLGAVGSGVKDVLGRDVTLLTGKQDDECPEGPAYLCAMVLPGVMSGAYEIRMWRHVVVPVELMEAEVLLEYDVATRYYYMTV